MASLPFTTGCEYYPIITRVLDGETTIDFRARLVSVIEAETGMTTEIQPLLPTRILVRVTVVYEEGNEVGEYIPASIRCIWLPEMDKYPSFKSGATHPFGGVYYD
jgi:hypothetical protein